MKKYIPPILKTESLLPNTNTALASGVNYDLCKICTAASTGKKYGGSFVAPDYGIDTVDLLTDDTYYYICTKE